MRFLRVGDPGAERPAVEDGDGVFDLGPLTPDLDGRFFEGGGIRQVRDALSAGGLSRVDVTGRRLGPPVARPAAVLCIGQNYAAHAAETGDPPPQYPIFFFKHPNTVVGPFDDIRRPRGAQKLDWEVELGVVIGRPARHQVMQDSRTSDLLFGPSEIIAYVSEIITLEPGDLIATGTPAGVGAARTPPVWLRPGQVVRTLVEGVGECLNRCLPEPAAG
jgi:2-keto-4-pentenoate hydratase/2-oxohepta-3-ene-1,7-dioic acid hydratase in catechol pathway